MWKPLRPWSTLIEYASMLKNFLTQNIQRRLVRQVNNWQIFRMALKVAKTVPQPKKIQPIAFFKASSGLDDLSWNSAFHLLTSWGLRLQGIPVVYFACDHGMSRCVMGTDRDRPSKKPPCWSCVYQARTLYTGTNHRILRRTFGSERKSPPVSSGQVHWFNFERNQQLENTIANLSLKELMDFKFQKIPLGALALPGLRWILRRHNLLDDDSTRFFLREYILSAFNIAVKFEQFLNATNPQSVVVFNGQFYPEATVKWVANQRGLRVISHEVGLQPATGFFTQGEATIYPIDIPASFELSDAQNIQLDAYLEKRFQGNFSMAGVKFWPSMKKLDASFNQKAANFKQIVPVFTNVIFDTSQPHANTVFADMFAWLNLVLQAVKSHPETLFVIRAHPDEARTRKASLETVAGWVEQNHASDLPNMIFVPPDQHLSSYELIARSKFVMIYNSTIGLEATIMGVPVLCAGKARFTQYPTVFFPKTANDFANTLDGFLSADTIEAPLEFRRNGRRFLYYQVFRTSLPFGEFLQSGIRGTHARLKWFDPLNLWLSPAIQTVTKGLLGNGDFMLEEELSSAQNGS